MPDILTRDDALAAGSVRYWTGQPCRHGHLSWRYTSNGICSKCHKDRQRKYHRTPVGLQRLVFDVHPHDVATVTMLVGQVIIARITSPAGADELAQVAFDRQHMAGLAADDLPVSNKGRKPLP